MTLALCITAGLAGCDPAVQQGAGSNLPPPPKATIEGDLTHDFGTIELSGRQTLAHTFTIRNADAVAHTISIDGTTCECVAAELPADTLAPGDSMPIDVSLLIGKPGDIEQKVYLNASGALVTLRVKAKVVEPAVGTGRV